MSSESKDSSKESGTPSPEALAETKGGSSGASTPPVKSPKPASKGGAYDPFIRDALFPDPEAIFSFSPEPLAEVKDQAVFVLDANVLLLPYTTGKLAFQEIKKVYERLVKDGRLIVPHQAAREFAVHRLEQIAMLYGGAQKWRDSLKSVEVHSSPSLELLPEFDQYRQVRAEADTKVNECRRLLAEIQQKLLDWYHADPVLSLYRELFTGAVLLGPTKAAEELKEDSEHRNSHKIPPGCSKEDASKPDGGIGDKVIWHTLLRVANERKCHAVFVTQDVTKGDWVHYHGHKGSERTLFPRYELTEEFRRVSDGKTLHIIELSTLLQLFDAVEEAVQSVQEAEQTEPEQTEWEPDRTLLRQLRRHLMRSSRSFGWLRDRGGIALTDDEFRRVIETYPEQFRFVRIIRRDKHGKRLIPGAPGMALTKQPKFFL